MLVGALLDAGASERAVAEALSKLPLPPFRWRTERAWRGAFVGTRFLVEAPAETRERHFAELAEIVRAAKLPARAEENALEVFTRIARAEAVVHGIAFEEVHFHEVGAVDTIADVVAACVALTDLGIEQVAASAVELGQGFVRCQHGTIPVPAPGALGALLGVPVKLGGLEGERTTPTGAALVAALAASIGDPIEITPERVGYGVGSKETRDVANLLRVVIGHAPRLADRVVVLETNLDDATGEVLGFVLEKLLEQGALDAFATPVVMKKGRPGFLLTALAPPERSHALEELLLRETPALGLRRTIAMRAKLPREVRSVETRLGAARVKLRWLGDSPPQASAEFEDAKRLATEQGIPLTEAMVVIEEAARRAFEGERPSRGSLPRALEPPSGVTRSSHVHPHPHAHEHAHGHAHGHAHSHEHSHGHGHEHGPSHTPPRGPASPGDSAVKPEVRR